MTDRDAHRAAVEAGYASLAEYIEKWGDDKMDIVERLRKPVDDIFFGEVVEPIKWEAADEIERLRKEIQWLADANAKLIASIQQKDSE